MIQQDERKIKLKELKRQLKKASGLEYVRIFGEINRIGQIIRYEKEKHRYEGLKESYLMKNTILKDKVKKIKDKSNQRSLKSLRDELKKVTHAIVRYGQTQCYTCKERDKLSAGHFWTDKGHAGTRYDFDNLRPQCTSCNSFKSGNLAVYGYKLRKELGDDRFEELYKRAHTEKRWSRQELEDLINERKQILDNLKK